MLESLMIFQCRGNMHSFRKPKTAITFLSTTSQNLEPLFRSSTQFSLAADCSIPRPLSYNQAKPAWQSILNKLKINSPADAWQRSNVCVVGKKKKRIILLTCWLLTVFHTFQENSLISNSSIQLKLMWLLMKKTMKNKQKPMMQTTELNKNQPQVDWLKDIIAFQWAKCYLLHMILIENPLNLPCSAPSKFNNQSYLNYKICLTKMKWIPSNNWTSILQSSHLKNHKKEMKLIKSYTSNYDNLPTAAFNKFLNRVKGIAIDKLRIKKRLMSQSDRITLIVKALTWSYCKATSASRSHCNNPLSKAATLKNNCQRVTCLKR